MKVIDLLNKIANGEAPKKIKVNENILNLKIGKGTSYEFETGGGMLSFDYYIENNKLDTIVEIIEDKKIEKLYGEPRHNYTENELYIVGKINEIIKVLNEMREDK